jgi:hypothetical protein
MMHALLNLVSDILSPSMAVWPVLVLPSFGHSYVLLLRTTLPQFI